MKKGLHPMFSLRPTTRFPKICRRSSTTLVLHISGVRVVRVSDSPRWVGLGVKFYPNQTKLRCFCQGVYSNQGIALSREKEKQENSKSRI